MSSSAPANSGSGVGSVVAGVDIGDPELAAALRADLGDVEDLLVSRIESGEKFLSDIALHLVKAGGKRFRPLLTVMAGRLGPNRDPESIVAAGVACEMVHLATLYHDDVMDEADVRRGVESANSAWTNSMAILAGDFLFAHGSMLVAQLGPRAVELIAGTFSELVTGQMRETVGRLGVARVDAQAAQGTDSPDENEVAARAADPIDHYVRVIWEKTGSLIATAARFGGIYSGLDDAQIEALGRYGDAVGVAFQIADDIIDISSASSDSGKVPGTDLREGVPTLPIIYVLDGTDPGEERLRELVSAPIEDDAEVAEAISLLADSAGMQQAKDKLAEYVRAAESELDTLPAGPANDALRALVNFTVSRVG